MILRATTPIRRRGLLHALGMTGVVAATSPSAGCRRTCDLQSETISRAGGNAQSCGHVAVTGDPSATDNCVRQAFVAGDAFYAFYDRAGASALVTVGISRSADGTTTYFFYDSAPCGREGCAPRIDALACNQPQQWAPGQTRPQGDPPITCGSYGSAVRICE